MNGFTKIKNKLIVSNLNSNEFRILCYLIARSKNGECFPSVGTIARDINISKRTIVRSLDNLIEENYIQKENRFLGTGKRTSNLYTINEEYLSKKTKQEIFETTQKEIEEPFDYDWLNEED